MQIKSAHDPLGKAGKTPRHPETDFVRGLGFAEYLQAVQLQHLTSLLWDKRGGQFDNVIAV